MTSTVHLLAWLRFFIALYFEIHNKQQARKCKTNSKVAQRASNHILKMFLSNQWRILNVDAQIAKIVQQATSKEATCIQSFSKDTFCTFFWVEHSTANESNVHPIESSRCHFWLSFKFLINKTKWQARNSNVHPIASSKRHWQGRPGIPRPHKFQFKFPHYVLVSFQTCNDQSGNQQKIHFLLIIGPPNLWC